MTNYIHSEGTLRFSAYDLVHSYPKVVRYALGLAQHRLIGTLLDCDVCDASAEVALEWWHIAQLLGRVGKLPRDASPGARACFEGAAWTIMFEASTVRAWALGGAAAVMETAREEWDYLRLQIEDEVYDRTKIGLEIPFDRMLRVAFTCWFAISLRDAEAGRLPIEGPAE